MPIDRQRAESTVVFEDKPLPFEDLPQGNTRGTKLNPHFAHFGESFDTPAQILVVKLEAYEPKEYLMSFYQLNWCGVDYPKVRGYMEMFEPQYNGDTWRLWKDAICDVVGKSWNECAQLIYGDYFNGKR